MLMIGNYIFKWVICKFLLKFIPLSCFLCVETKMWFNCT